MARVAVKPSGCWEWLGPRHPKGYGLVSSQGKTLRCHRVALEAKLGKPLGKLWALHRCDNPPCCNPAHLFPGTQPDNWADGVRKGRVTIATKGAKPHHFGERSSQAKVTAQQVREIRARFAAGESKTALAKAYGVTLSPINKIILRKTWGNVS